MSLLTFLFIRLIPGDAIAARLGTSTALTPEQLASLRAYFGLDQPLLVQYWTWLTSLLRGDAGYSIRTGRPVVVEIAERLPATLELAAAAALDRDRDRDPARSAVGGPADARASTSRRAIGGLIGLSLAELLARDADHRPLLAVSALASRTPAATSTSCATRSANLKLLLVPGDHARPRARGGDDADDALGDARRAERGLRAHRAGQGPSSPRSSLRRHALKNGLIVVVTLLGIQVGQLLGGAVVVEEIFSVPGVGRMLLTAIVQRDYALVQGGVLAIAILFVALNIVVDLLYGYLDPRIRLA